MRLRPIGTWSVGILGPAMAMLSLAGCGLNNQVVDAFPTSDMAAPWALRDTVWRGTFAEATPGLGEEAQEWAQFNPQDAWLAIYCHMEHTDRCLTVRCFSFPSADDAQRAYTHFCPEKPLSFNAGDEGCWTEFGVLFRWGRLVCEIFGPDASWSSQTQAALLSAFFTGNMPGAAPQNPR